MLILLRLAASLALRLRGCRTVCAACLLSLVALLLLLLTPHMAASACGLGFCRRELVCIAAGMGSASSHAGDFSLAFWIHRGKASSGTPGGIGHFHAPEKLQIERTLPQRSSRAAQLSPQPPCHGNTLGKAGKVRELKRSLLINWVNPAMRAARPGISKRPCGTSFSAGGRRTTRGACETGRQYKNKSA